MWFRVFLLLLFRLVPFSFSFTFTWGWRGRAARRRTRSGGVFPLLMKLLLLPSRTRGWTTMTSQRDRVVRARTAPIGTMSDHQSWKMFTWVSVLERNSITTCVTISPWRTRDIRMMSGSDWPMLLVWPVTSVTDAQRVAGVTDARRQMFRMWQLSAFGKLVCLDIRTVRVRKVLKDFRILWQMFCLQIKHVARLLVNIMF